MLTEAKKIIRDLGDGLILRHASTKDADILSQFNGEIHAENEVDRLHLMAWTRDLLTRPHPTLKPEDFTIIEEASTGRIVSSLNLIPQTWSYEGIEFGVGRPELVGTLPDYRGRGLVRIQFDEIHRWSAERGHLVQAITGIPYFYRQFGYEMTINHDGRRYGYESHVPKLKEGAEETYHVRLAREADLPFITRTHSEMRKRSMIVCERTPEIFRYELGSQEIEHAYAQTCVIEDKTGALVGFFRHLRFVSHGSIAAYLYELKAGASWLEVTPSVVRYLWQTGREYAQHAGTTCVSFCFALGAEHPAYEAIKDRLPDVRDPYAWYIRVPDLPGFLNHIKPVLEKRLVESVATEVSREIKISFYRGGLRFVIEHGHITGIESWKPTPKEEGDIAFPYLTFLQILFGYRSYAELHYAFPDCWCDNEEVRVLINSLFPKKHSQIYPIA
jgi:hypothetical protein